MPFQAHIRTTARCFAAALCWVLGTTAPGELIPRCGFHPELFLEGMYRPTALSADAAGYLYIAAGLGDWSSRPVHRADREGALVASDPIPDPDGIAATAAGRVLVAGATKISEVDFPSGDVSYFAGCFGNLSSIAIDDTGTVYVGDNNGTVFRVTPDCGGEVIGHTPHGTDAVLAGPDAIYFGDYKSQIYRWQEGQVTTFTEDLDGVHGMAFARGGPFGDNMFVVDGAAKHIREVDESGAVTEWGSFTVGPDDNPVGIAFTDSATMHISSPEGGMVWKVQPSYLELVGEVRVGATVSLVLHDFRDHAFCIVIGRQEAEHEVVGYGLLRVDWNSRDMAIEDVVTESNHYSVELTIPDYPCLAGQTVYVQAVVQCDADANTGFVTNRLSAVIEP